MEAASKIRRNHRPFPLERLSIFSVEADACNPTAALKVERDLRARSGAAEGIGALRTPERARRSRSTELPHRLGSAMRLLAIVAVLCTTLHPFHAAAVSPDDLVLVLSAEATTILVGEPLGIRLRVENKTGEDIVGDFYPTYDLDRVRIAISKDDGPLVPYVSKVMEDAAFKKLGAELVTIPAGGAIEGREVIAFDVERGQPAFPTAGMYEIQAVLLYDFYAQALTSNTVTVTVHEPTGSDGEAWGFVRANGLAYLLSSEAGSFPVDEAAIGKLRELARSFPASRYAPVAETALNAICAQSVGLAAVPAGCPAPTTCVGDCGRNRTVTVEELVRGVNIALGLVGVSDCRSFDRNEDGEVNIDELVIAVGNAVQGCGGETP